MARARVQDKQQAILDAAIAVFAERGFWDTPTSLISKTAGVADGTLFNYFKTKDDLINEVYLEIKHELAERLGEDRAADAQFESMMRHFWNGYVDWALENPHKFSVLQQIGSSYTLSDEVKAAAMEHFIDIHGLACASIARGEMHDYPVEFLIAVLDGLAVTTVRYIATHELSRDEAAVIKNVGFDILWQGVIK